MKENEDTIFIIHIFSSSNLYITYFSNYYIPPQISYLAIKAVCEILIKNNLTPTIRIVKENENLIRICKKIGFRRRYKDFYCLEAIK